VIASKGPRLFEAFVPDVPDSLRVGPSLAELRDEVALAVMEWASSALAESVAERALAPHYRCKQLKVDTVALDPTTRTRTVLKASVSVLAQKWPHEDFWIVTPTRVASARFAASSLDDLDKTLARRLCEYCIEQGLFSLEQFESHARERVEPLELDVDPSTPLSRSAARAASNVTAAGTAASTTKSPQRERYLARLKAKTLRAVAQNISYAAQDGLLRGAFGRDAIVEQLVAVAESTVASAVLLVGPTGVGKSAIIRECAKRLLLRSRDGERRDVWQLDPSRFIAGMSYVGQWEARALSLVDELKQTDDMLCVADLTALAFVGRTSKSADNLAKFLTEPISRGDIRVIGECSPESLQRLRQEVPAFARLFQVIPVAAMSERETLSVLLSVTREAEHLTTQRTHESKPLPTALQLTAAAMETVVSAAKRHFTQRALPGSAIALLHTALDDTTVETAGGQRVLDSPQVLGVIAQTTGLPRYLIGLDPPKPAAQIHRELSEKVAGQPEAIDAATDAVMTVQCALGDPDKPVATYLFVGPTGVGKTETAKALAHYLYGSSSRLLRFDMSEFSSRASAARFVGDTWQQEGELTTALRAQPFSVILLDEVEKAHPSVFDTLLRLLGEGKLTDARGTTSDARASVIVMTSNLGVREASTQTGFIKITAEQARAHYVAAAAAYFRPEFFNRIDRVVAFRSLEQGALRVVVRNALRELLARRGVRSAEIVVDVEPRLLELLVEQAFDPRFGARPLRRALERKIALPLAYHLLSRQQHDGAMIQVLRNEQQMTLAVRPMRDCPAIAIEASAAALSVNDELAGLRRRVDRCRVSPAIERLQALRKDALSRLSLQPNPTGAEGTAVRLLDELESIEARVVELESAETEVSAFEERVARGYAQRSPTVVQTTQSERVLHERLRKQIRELHDEFTILEHLLTSAAESGQQTVTVLFTPLLPPAENLQHWAWLRHVTPVFGASVSLWTERGSQWVELGDPQIVDDSQWVSTQRYAFVLEGPGLRALLSSIEGHALFRTHGAEDSVQLVRIAVLNGAGPTVIALEDQRQEQCTNELRVRPNDAPEKHTVWVSLRLEGERLVHVATGLAATAREAICAQWLRHQHAGL
jgi:ATP-dependent Clp protease ATP-binding subunit ClpC